MIRSNLFQSARAPPSRSGKGTRAGLIELLSDEEQGDPDERMALGVPHPSVLQWIVAEVGVELADVPTWTTATAPVGDPVAV